MFHCTLFSYTLDVVGVIDFVQGKIVYTKGNEERSHVKFGITNERRDWKNSSDISRPRNSEVNREKCVRNNIKKVCDAYNAVEIKPLLEAVCGSALFEIDDEANHDSSMITVAPNAETTSPDDTLTTKSSGTKAKGRKSVETVEGSEDIPTKDMNKKKKGRKVTYNWRVKVRVVRLWRGATKQGEQFKSFNVLLLDDKGNRIHRFVPGNIAEEVLKHIGLGMVHIISNFQITDGRTTVKFTFWDALAELLENSLTEELEVPLVAQ
ncbi:hypothetical protein POM88_002218 [Heracleum sosnowskyi]|uniref:Replication protein A 70 kDa DNA-binding subunit B/D first OB fold domain-containing protein n=1 Tax=Heracleum sosnowskyi TaxID=360622 RepID=A0AAD8JGE4_9APIA|nr:hypothetical protein POM88_002218 [Heracleum sosnowskyi]